MILTEFWKVRMLYRTCPTKPLTTSMLKSAAPHIIIQPRVNITASGDMLVVLKVRRRQPPPELAAGMLAPLPSTSPYTCNGKLPLPLHQHHHHNVAGGQHGQQQQQQQSSSHQTASAAAVAATPDPELRARVQAALTPLLCGEAVAGAACGADREAVEAGVDAVWPPSRSPQDLLCGCLARIIMRQALEQSLDAPLCINLEFAGK